MNSGRLKTFLAQLERQAMRVLGSEGFDRTEMRFQHSLDIRYLGQAYELNVPASGNVVDAFHRAHEQRYGYHNQNAKVEIVNVRCRATGITEKPPAAKLTTRRARRSAPAQTTQLVFEGRQRKANLYQREDLRAGDVFSGPAVIVEYSATTLIPPQWEAYVDDCGQLALSQNN